ncbi:MAG: ParA family protein [Campylobacterota bacterium]|nr:ParA family protein [Campylobacterota bacterium]
MANNLKIMVLSSKGGVGKSTITMQLIAPYLYKRDNKKISFYEFDDENSDCLSYGDSTLTSREIVDVSSTILREQITDIVARDESACFDIGGNKTTTMVIDSMAENGMIHFINLVVIPLLDGEQDGINASVVYSVLKGMRPDLKFLFVLNRAKNHKHIKYQFDNYFGDIRGIFRDDTSVKNYLFDEDKDKYAVMLDDEIIKHSRRFGLTVYEIAHKEQDFIAQLKLNMKDLSHEQEVKLISFKNYIQKASKDYYKDVLSPAHNIIDSILEDKNDDKTT